MTKYNRYRQAAACLNPAERGTLGAGAARGGEQRRRQRISDGRAAPLRHRHQSVAVVLCLDSSVSKQSNVGAICALGFYQFRVATSLCKGMCMIQQLMCSGYQEYS